MVCLHCQYESQARSADWNLRLQQMNDVVCPKIYAFAPTKETIKATMITAAQTSNANAMVQSD